jgi:Domain of unknown function (DUF4262)
VCWECDHPDATRDDYLDHMMDLMDTFGWAVQGVEGDGIHPPWAYTLGLTRIGQPELVTTGLSLHRATHLLNGQAGHLTHAPAFRPGEQFELAGGPVIQIIEVAEPTAHLHIAVELFGPRIRALQLVHADDRGHWPWEAGYRGVQGGQPVLGTVPPSLTPRAAAPTGDERPPGRAKVVRTQPSRGSGSRRGTRGPQRRSARGSSRRPSTRR